MEKTFPALVLKHISNPDYPEQHCCFMHSYNNGDIRICSSKPCFLRESCGDRQHELQEGSCCIRLKHGLPADVAEKIGDVLCENGFRVDMRPALEG